MINIQQLKNLIGPHAPKTALILGSGLGKIADIIANPLVIKYSDIQGFPQSTVAGHKGQMIIGKIGKNEVLCLQGRFHLYEGHQPQTIKEVIQALKQIGIEKMIVTNAAGSLKSSMPAGSLMMISDHINFSGRNPLVGINDEKQGPRFPDMSNAYNKDMRLTAQNLAQKLNIKLYEGVYLMVLGPNFETAAEIRAFQILGADAVGMSTVPEVISAVHAGIKVLAFSVITNLGTGLQKAPLSHEETISQADEAGKKLTALITSYLEEY